METSPKAYSVTAITRMIKNQLEESFKEIWVEGEISAYAEPASGHKYITLKDDGAIIKMVMWRSVAANLRFKPEPGQKVLAFGDITVYPQGGNYQLSCKKIRPVGIGELELAFRQLYEKLHKAGYFDPVHRKPIPRYVSKIGIVTSPTGAAVRDIINVSKRRNSSVKLTIFPAKVQGEGADETIKNGIEYFNSREDIDLIIIGRGGGSQEDLWCFNSEILVKTIYDSKIPIISAVGHEVDTSLCDLVADLRAATPSAAAELAVWDKEAFLDSVKENLDQQNYMLENLISQLRDELFSLVKRPVFRKPEELIFQKSQQLDQFIRILKSAGKSSFDKVRNRLSLALARLDTLSPLKIIERGYSVAKKDVDDSIIISVNDISKGELIKTILSDGLLFSTFEKSVRRKLK